MIPTVGFNMRKITKGNVTIKLWDIGGQVSKLLNNSQQTKLRLVKSCETSVFHFTACIFLCSQDFEACGNDIAEESTQLFTWWMLLTMTRLR